MSEIAIAENSVALLDAALDAAGGLEHWRAHSFLSAHLSQGGGLWAMKGQAGVLDDVRVDVALHQEWVSHHPFGAPELRSSFTPPRVEIRDDDGMTVEALDDPRGSFATHAFDTPWTRPQLAYFVGTAMPRPPTCSTASFPWTASHCPPGTASIHATPPTASIPATSSWRSTSTTSRSGSCDPSNRRRLLILASNRELLELRSCHLRPRDREEQRTTASELFFDLVYVFAVTQLFSPTW